MLRVNLRALEHGSVEIAGSLAPDDPRLDGLDVELAKPVKVTGQLAGVGPGRYYWRGEVTTTARGQCRRCLTPVDVAVTVPVGVMFTDDPSADDPSAWVIEPNATVLDLSQPVREELILSAPTYVLCRDDCRGLCPGCGEDLNVGSCRCRPSTDPRWGSLETLRNALPDDSR
ncbi:MAG: hypothetical protein A3K13_00250 [Gemmatimonadetes bacterium RIFCSPLOWO2_12_FULL_68_9]|nr:MAG: hypothetical protein A3K13_00250 [Gemmatimonadetes bacterium RIFCSPLOWO2_12_FULL_68_9]